MEEIARAGKSHFHPFSFVAGCGAARSAQGRKAAEGAMGGDNPAGNCRPTDGHAEGCPASLRLKGLSIQVFRLLFAGAKYRLEQDRLGVQNAKMSTRCRPVHLAHGLRSDE